jgi:hypothetical protein
VIAYYFKLLTWCAVLFIPAYCWSASDGSRELQDVEARILHTDREKLHTQRLKLLERLTDRHPDVVRINSDIQDLDARIAALSKIAEPKTELETVSLANPVSAGVASEIKVAKAPSPQLVERRIQYDDSFNNVCARPGVLACFDFEGDSPIESTMSSKKGALSLDSKGAEQPKYERGFRARGRTSLRMNYLASDAANHGAFDVLMDEYEEGDTMVVQWRQWFSPELVVHFDENRLPVYPKVGGDGSKQLTIAEIGDTNGCSFGGFGLTTSRFLFLVISHGCNIWYVPNNRDPTGTDRADLDFQPGGDNTCRYNYQSHASYLRDVDYVYPTVPKNLLDEPRFSDSVGENLVHGCFGWLPNQWITFRFELTIQFCREAWNTNEIPESCRDLPGRVRYWVKYSNERRPWLVYDKQMPTRWHDAHSGRFGHFKFTPYNTNEKPLPNKPPAFTLYDDIIFAKNVTDLPWPSD